MALSTPDGSDVQLVRAGLTAAVEPKVGGQVVVSAGEQLICLTARGVRPASSGVQVRDAGTGLDLVGRAARCFPALALNQSISSG